MENTVSVYRIIRATALIGGAILAAADATGHIVTGQWADTIPWIALAVTWVMLVVEARPAPAQDTTPSEAEQ
nr:hypothetical protein [Streptomyces sp. SID5468]